MRLCTPPLPPSAWGGRGGWQWVQRGQWRGRACEDTGASSLRARRPPPPRNLRSLESCLVLPIPPHPHRLCRHSRPPLAGSLVRSAPQAPAHWALTSLSHTADSWSSLSPGFASGRTQRSALLAVPWRPSTRHGPGLGQRVVWLVAQAWVRS